MHVWNSKEEAMDKKGKKSGSIRKETDNKSGALVSVDQIQSDHPGLVPQLSVKLKSARIWSAQVMMYHFSDLTYMNLMIGTS